MGDPTPADRTRLRPVPPTPSSERARFSGSLPVFLTSFEGRSREIARVCALLNGETRLVTLVGPGGVGKTRLALAAAHAAAHAFPDGVAFVGLASVADPDLVLPAIAHAFGVRDAPDRSPGDLLAAFLGDRQILLVLDNLEQVVEAAPRVAGLLVARPCLAVLATSRVRLRLSGGREYPVLPLDLPGRGGEGPAADPAQSAAVRLFVARAGAVTPDFALTAEDVAAVAAICRRLDGLPLAIELAAARVAHLPPAALLARLEQRLPLLTGGPRDAPRRQQTMRDAIAWSYDLLPADEQALFRRLAVFAGGFALDAAEAVAGDAARSVFDALCALVDASLVQRADGPGERDPDGPRYLLLETVREYGLEQLAASGEAEAARDRHVAFFVALAERDRPPIGSAGPPERVAALRREDANLRAALGWIIEREDAETGLRLVTALASWWRAFWMREGRTWIERVLALGGDAAPDLRALALGQAGFAAYLSNDLAPAAAAGERALVDSRARGDVTGAAFALALLSAVATARGDHDRADALIAESVALSRQAGDPAVVALRLESAGAAAGIRGDLDRAIARFEESLVLLRGAGNAREIGHVLANLAFSVHERGDPRRAAGLAREALGATWGPREEERLIFPLDLAATVARAAGRTTEAARLRGAEARLRARFQVPILTKDEAHYGRERDALRRALGEAESAAAWAAGEALPVAEAVAEANAVLAAIVDTPTAAITSAHGLTPRELEVIRLIAAGQSNRQIADALFIAVPTVKRHLTNIFGELGVTSRSALNTYAHTHDLV